MLKKTVISLALAAVCAGAYADYFLSVPMSTRAGFRDSLGVSLSGAAMPAAIKGQSYAGFDLRALLTVTGDSEYTGGGVTWEVISGSLPAGLEMVDGMISGTPSEEGAFPFQVRATYKGKNGQQAYQVLVGEIVVSLQSAQLPGAWQPSPMRATT